MNGDDTLYGIVRSGVLTLGGNNASLKIENGVLVVTDGPIFVRPGDPDPPPLKDRMIVRRFSRSECGPGRALERIVATRPDGFVTLAAFEWLRGAGVEFVQIDWQGEPIACSLPDRPDRPMLRRAQALAIGTEAGLRIANALIAAQLATRARVARMLGGADAAALIDRLAQEVRDSKNFGHTLAIEASAASAYWPLWQDVRVRFARRDRVPDHWRVFEMRRPTASSRPRKATSPIGAVLNYLYGIAVGQVGIALYANGIDPGLGVLHTDKEGRASLAYDAVEPIRPFVEAWTLAVLARSPFAKRDFYEEPDGTIRLTRPLTSYLAMSVPLWRMAAGPIAEWLARAFADIAGRIEKAGSLSPPGVDEAAIEAAELGLPLPVPDGSRGPRRRRPLAIRTPTLPPPPAPLPSLFVPGRPFRPSLAGAVMPHACAECGAAIEAGRRFCSTSCTAVYKAELRRAKATDDERLAEELRRLKAGDQRRTEAFRKHRAEQTRFDKRREAAGISREQLREWYIANIGPRLAELRPADIAKALGLSYYSARNIARRGTIPHARHFAALAALVGIEAPRVP